MKLNFEKRSIGRTSYGKQKPTLKSRCIASYTKYTRRNKEHTTASSSLKFYRHVLDGDINLVVTSISMVLDTLILADISKGDKGER